MQSRKKHRKSATTSLPKDFLRAVTDLFNKQFNKERTGSEFLVYGDLYMDEVLLCVSLTNAKSLLAATVYTSLDLPSGVSEKPEQVTEKLKSMVDLTASWFGQSFTDAKAKGIEGVLESLRDQPDAWQELTWEKEQMFVRLNRENRTLEHAAERFLKEKGIDPDSDEFLVEDGDFEDDDEDSGPSHLH